MPTLDNPKADPRLRIELLAPACGARVLDVDLNQLTDDQLRNMRRLLAQRGVLLIENQSLTPEQQIAFGRRWGEIDFNAYFPAHPDHPEIAVICKEKDQKNNLGGGWHTDHSYFTAPSTGSILLARETPPTGGDTLFTSMYAAYDGLSDGVKQTLASLRAFHSADQIYGPGGYFAATDQKDTLQGFQEGGGAVHPVVIIHPDSGRKILYVNPAFTVRFDGWTREESQPLLNYLYSRAIQPGLICRVRWRPGSVAIWDNRSTWHFAQNDYHGHRRLMHRITLAGRALQA